LGPTDQAIPGSETDEYTKRLERQTSRRKLVILSCTAAIVLPLVVYSIVTGRPTAPWGALTLTNEPQELSVSLEDGRPLSFLLEARLRGDHEYSRKTRSAPPDAAVLHMELRRGQEMFGATSCHANTTDVCIDAQRERKHHWQCWLACNILPERAGTYTLRAWWTAGPQWPADEVVDLVLTPEQR